MTGAKLFMHAYNDVLHVPMLRMYNMTAVQQLAYDMRRSCSSPSAGQRVCQPYNVATLTGLLLPFCSVR